MDLQTTTALVSGPAQQGYERKGMVLESAEWIKGVYPLRAEIKWYFRRQAERDGQQ